MILRRLKLPANPKRTFFLWGPRQTGKTSLLRAAYPETPRIDLLKSDQFIRYANRPALLREELSAPDSCRFVIIDEVQKIPLLLDEVQWLIEERNLVFALCGSSARKLKRGHANLLGGRALRHVMHGLVSDELGESFDILRALNHGYLPLNYLDDDPVPGLRSYVADYLKEEIAEEGLVRNLPAFSRFLDVAAISDGQIIKYANIAQDCGVSAPTVKEYYQILEDTYLGSYLPSFVVRPKRKVIQSPKFFLSDVGVVNLLAKRGPLAWGGQLTGFAFENWIYHELSAHREYSGIGYDLSYWHLHQGIEVDFVLGGGLIAVEAKAVDSVSGHHFKGLHEIRREHPSITRAILVCMEENRRTVEGGIEIIPAREFVRELWAGGIIR